MSTKQRRLIPAVVGLASGVLAASVLAWVAWNAGSKSTAQGILAGASVVLIAAVVLWIVGPRAGLAGRVANAKADERDRAIVSRALADSALAMLVAAAGCLIWSLYGAEAIAVVGVVMWTGLLAFIASTLVRSRRG